MNNILPNSLEKLILWIIQDKYVESWRYTCENKVTLSIRFVQQPAMAASTPQPHPNIATAADDFTTWNSPTVQDRDRRFRSKPPSSIFRDNVRQQVFLTSKQAGGLPASAVLDVNIADSGVEEQTHTSHVLPTDKKIKDNHGNLGYAYSQPELFADSGFQATPGVAYNCSTNLHMNDMAEPVGDMQDDTNNPVCNVMTQTIEIAASQCTQTEKTVVPSTSTMTQHPGTKKKSIQTDSISKHVKIIQTEAIIKQDKVCQYVSPHMQSRGVITEQPYKTDRSTTTDPFPERHTQTITVNMVSKKTGIRRKDISTQTRYKTKTREKCSGDVYQKGCASYLSVPSMHQNIPYIDDDVDWDVDFIATSIT